MEWQQPHWSGKPQPRSAPRQRLRPNGFARMARFAVENRIILVALYVVLAILCAGAAAALLDVDPDQSPRITLDETTAKLEAQLETQFPGIEQTFLAIVDSRDPETSREQALALAQSLSQRNDLFQSAFVPGTGEFYDTNALLFRDVGEVRARVDALLQMQPLYQAISAAPDILGLAALVSEISNAVEQGRSPPGLENLLLAVSAAIEGEVKGRSRPIQWTALAGLGGEARSQRWFVLATPKPGLERQAAAIARQASEGMQGLNWLWPRRALANAASPLRDFVVPGGLSVFVTFTLLGAGLGSFRQTLAVMLSGAVTIAAAAAAASVTGRTLDAATWSFALAALAPVMVGGTIICLTYAQARARGLSAQQSVMMAAHRKGALVTAIAFLFAAFWLSWMVRQLPSMTQLSLIALVGTAVAWLVVNTLLPACLVLFAGRNETIELHWLDDALAGETSHHTGHALDVVAMVVLAAAVFSAAFLPGVRFGERQLPSAPGPYLETPDARGAVHIIAETGFVPGIVSRLSSLPEVGAIRTAAQFLPPDAGPKIAEVRRLADLLPFEPVKRDPAEEDVLRQSFADLEQQLTAIAAGPAVSQDLRDAALRLRRAVSLFANPLPPTQERVSALEKSLFGSLVALSSRAQQLAHLEQPGVAGLDPRLLRRFVSEQGLWRIEVMPRSGTGTLSFAAALRRAVPSAAGEPVAALVRNEIIHHETLLALAFAMVAAAVLVLAALRSLTGWLVSMVPAVAFVTLTAATVAALDIGLTAAMLAGTSAAIAVLLACSIVLAEHFTSPAPETRRGMMRAGLVPPLALAGAVIPLAVSSRAAVAELGALMALLLAMAALLCILLVPALCRWFQALTRRPSTTGNEPYVQRDKRKTR